MKSTKLINSVALLAATTACSANTYDPRIIGGVPVSIDSHPWMVGLVHKDADAKNVFCGASLIEPRWVLTAAHCLVRIEAGTLDIIAGTATLGSQQAERVSVDAIVIHPDYVHSELKNDIALLRLSKAIAHEVITYKVPIGADHVGASVSVSGWGNQSISGTQFPAQLHAVSLTISEFSVCNNAYLGRLSVQQICASNPGGTKDSCQGDSGGPLVTRFDNSDIQVGIVSFGRECASPTHPGVYTRVAYYERFIDTALSATATPPADNWAGLNEED